MNEHPSKEQLRSFQENQLAEPEAIWISQHVEDCPDCQEILDCLAPFGPVQSGSSNGSVRNAAESVQAVRPNANAVAAKNLVVDADNRATPTNDQSEVTTDDAPQQPPMSGPPGVKPGESRFPAIPGYEILEELGHGGMGIVYKARQLSLNRLVALKMILSGGQLSEKNLARFQAEAEAVAKLRHPNIVQIYEIGELPGDGIGPPLPFLSLEFVEGDSLAARLNGTPQPPKQAAVLLEALACAVQHAHDNGVVHRDLKPANILLCEIGVPSLNECTPKITDFGLAKRIEVVGHTQTGQILGTPSYMSPEQASGKSKEIGPSTDVYALGAVLYETLTGRPPFKAESVLETLKQVQNDEPVLPRILQPRLPRDLETICLKCLEKAPSKRYTTATELAKDLRRFVNNEPIHARPTATRERLVKWMRRYPALASLIAALVIGITGTSVGAIAALVQRNRAIESANSAEYERGEAEKNFKRAETARIQADEEAGKYKAIYRYVSDTIQRTSPKKRDRSDPVTLALLLDEYSVGIDSGFGDKPLQKGAMHNLLGTAYEELGLYRQAERHLSLAVNIHQRTLGPEHPETLSSITSHASALHSQGRSVEALRLLNENHQALIRIVGPAHETTLSCANNLAGVLHTRGKKDEAERLMRQTYEDCNRILGDTHEWTLKAMGNLAVLLRHQGKLNEAEGYYYRAWQTEQQTLGPEHPSALGSLNNLVVFLADAAKLEEAVKLSRQLVDSSKRVFGEEHPQTLRFVGNLAALLHGFAQDVEAETYYRLAAEGARRTVGLHAEQTLTALHNFSHFLVERYRFEEAEPILRELRDILSRTLPAEHPRIILNTKTLAALLCRQGKLSQAKTLLKETIEKFQRVHGPSDPRTLTVAKDLADVLYEEGKWSDAEAIYRQCYNQIGFLLPERHHVALDLKHCRGRALQHLGKSVEAERLLRTCLSAYRDIHGAKSQRTRIAQRDLAMLLLTTGKVTEAEEFLHAVLDDASSERYAPDAQSLLGGCLTVSKRFKEAEPLVLQGYERVCRAYASGFRRRDALGRIIQLYDAWGRPEAAAKWRAFEVMSSRGLMVIP